jgi:hypothetical protein
MDQALCLFGCIPWCGPLRLGNHGWIIRYPTRLVIDGALSPNRIKPIPDHPVVSQAQKLFRHVTLASQVGGHCVVNTMGGDLYFRDRLAKALAKAMVVVAGDHPVEAAGCQSPMLDEFDC